MGRGKSRRSKHMCGCCGNFNCDPMHTMFMRTPWARKLDKRLEAGVCIACGHKPCKCKNRREPTSGRV